MEVKKPLSKEEQFMIDCFKDPKCIGFICINPRQLGRRLMYKRISEELNTIDIEEVKPKELK